MVSSTGINAGEDICCSLIAYIQSALHFSDPRSIGANPHNLPQTPKIASWGIVIVASQEETGISQQSYDCSFDDLSEFEQVAGRVSEEGELAVDGVELERLGHDLDAASSEVGDGLLNIRHIDAEVVIAGVAETVAKVGIRGSVNRQRITATEQLY